MRNFAAAMMIELHHVTIGQRISNLSAIVREGQIASINGSPDAGKSTLLRAALGFLAIDGGHICIDGELMTPQSAPWFRRMTAYVPQWLSAPEGYDAIPDYVERCRQAVASGKSLLFVDEADRPLSAEEQDTVDSLLCEAAARGATILTVNSRIAHIQISL